jgi:hypothetical protein
MAWKGTLRYAWRFPEGTVVLRIDLDLVGRADPDRFRTAPGIPPVVPGIQPLHDRMQPVEARWSASGQIPHDQAPRTTRRTKPYPGPKRMLLSLSSRNHAGKRNLAWSR